MNPRGLSVRLTLALALGLCPLGAALAQAGGGTNCPPARPVLTGPSSVRAGESYSLSWTNVLGEKTGASDLYVVERAVEATFSVGVDRVKTTRPAVTLPPGPAGATLLFHRVVVVSSCPTTQVAAIVSNTLVIQVTTACPTPDPVGEITVTPSDPPALTTYVVSWDVGGANLPGPGGGGPANLSYRLRRTTPWGTKESVSTAGSASFADLPGEYVYQVRAETPCGAAGPWSNPKKVVVGSSPPAGALVLVTEPKALAAVSPTDFPSTSFQIRNGGTAPLRVEAKSEHDWLDVTPTSFQLGPNATQWLSATARVLVPLLRPLHSGVQLRALATSLRVPIDLVIASAPAASPVAWSETEADIDRAGNPVLRSITNPGAVTAWFVSSVQAPWLSVESTESQAWDRPLAPGETRIVRIAVDRAKRRSTSGTELGVVSLVTAGKTDAVQGLTVVDDGPALPVSPGGGAGGPSTGQGARTRLLYAAVPNSLDALGVGRFTSDLWLTNLDAVAPIDVSLTFTPVGSSRDSIESRRVDLKLDAGETRRYRNIVGNVLGNEGAFALEVASPSMTLSATDTVSSSPLVRLNRARKALGTPDASAAAPNGEYGFEMRPIAPGEGAKATDPTFVVSGLLHDARHRSNLLLRETTGNDTTILIELFQNNGDAVTRNGLAVRTPMVVPAGGTLQLNDADLFDGAPLTPSPYALVTFQAGILDAFGQMHGAVVPMATVIDAGTQDGSLRVGASTNSLNPLPSPSSSPSAGRAASRPDGPMASGLPFGGGAAPLLFPVAHARGAPLGSGQRPFWKTRVTFTNVNEHEQRTVRLRLLDQTGNAPVLQSAPFPLPPRTVFSTDDLLEEFFDVPPDTPVYGAIQIENVRKADGTQSWQYTWTDVDVQTETYTPDPGNETLGEFKTGMEGFSYRHGYSSFQSNLGTVQIDGAESSSRYRTNLILHEVGGASCNVAVSAYLPGSFVPIATAGVVLPPFGYISKELFGDVLGLGLSELTDVRVVVRQIDGDGVFMAFASKINLVTGDPANIFLRPASAGTGR